jgi:hypothetical protein
MKNEINMEFSRRMMSELFKVYADYMLIVKTDAEWDRVELLFSEYKQFIKIKQLVV